MCNMYMVFSIVYQALCICIKFFLFFSFYCAGCTYGEASNWWAPLGSGAIESPFISTQHLSDCCGNPDCQGCVTVTPGSSGFRVPPCFVEGWRWRLRFSVVTVPASSYHRLDVTYSRNTGSDICVSQGQHLERRTRSHLHSKSLGTVSRRHSV